MVMKRQILILVLATILIHSCSKNNDPLATTDVLIFGHFYGMCQGEQCVEIFRLEKDKIYEDKNDKYPNNTNFYEGSYFQLPQTKYDEAKELISFFPQDLLNEFSNTIGQPDAADQGGYYIEYNFNGTRKFWLIDKDLNNVPAKYHNFLNKVRERITTLQ